MLQAAGIPPIDLLTIASLNPARFLGVGDMTGSIVAGKAADFVLLDRDPVTGADALTGIDAVYRGGQRVFARPGP